MKDFHNDGIFILPNRITERKSVYDIHCKTLCGKRFIVEMQNYPQPYFADSSLFYAARERVDSRLMNKKSAKPFSDKIHLTYIRL